MIESAEEFSQLCDSDDRAENRRAVTEPASDQTWLEIIDHSPELRVDVARNKTLPDSVLDRLVADPDPRVRFTVAMKRKLTPGQLELLARDLDEGIRLQVARHKNTPLAVLESLRNDSWSEVRSVVLKRLET